MKAQPIGKLAAAQLMCQSTFRRDLLAIMHGMEVDSSCLIDYAQFGGEYKTMKRVSTAKEYLIARHPELFGGRVYRTKRTEAGLILRRTA